ncbi:hypothetical protein Tco_0591539 [Tanacetum coccineum]
MAGSLPKTIFCCSQDWSAMKTSTEEVHEGTEEVQESTTQVHEGTAQVNEGTAQVNEGTAEVNESTTEKIKVPLLFVKVPLVLSDILEHLPSTSAGPSRKRRRSPMTSVPALSPVSGALSPVRANLIPSPKRVKIWLAGDVKIQTEIDEYIAYADALRDRGIDARVVVEAIDRDEIETGVRGPVEVRVERVTHPVMPEDIPEPSTGGSIEATYKTLEIC